MYDLLVAHLGQHAQLELASGAIVPGTLESVAGTAPLFIQPDARVVNLTLDDSSQATVLISQIAAVTWA